MHMPIVLMIIANTKEANANPLEYGLEKAKTDHLLDNLWRADKFLVKEQWQQ